VPIRVAAAVALTAALLASQAAGAARETTNFVFAVTAKGAPQPTEVSCQGSGWTEGSQLCLQPGSSYRWTGTLRDGAAGLSGALTGRCSASGRANGTLSGGVFVTARALSASASFTLTEYGQTAASCTFLLSFPHGSLSGTAVVTSLLQEGDATGTSSESVALVIAHGTGIYAGRTGRGGGKIVTTVPPTTVRCIAEYACHLPIPLVIPRTDAQSEAWHVTLH
jgi:hypothetical protein